MHVRVGLRVRVRVRLRVRLRVGFRVEKKFLKVTKLSIHLAQGTVSHVSLPF